jgi:hypothetical protein
MKIGKIIAGYSECQTELCEQNAGLFNVQVRSTYTVLTAVLQTEFFRAVKRGVLTIIVIDILYVH